ncbi:MAG: hypothetical protein R3B09_23750 [Nannocystaceae bacterium]
MRPLSLLLVAPLVACGTGPVTEASATDTGSSTTTDASTGATAVTVSGSTTATTAAETESGTVGMTESGTTTSTSTTDVTATTTVDTDGTTTVTTDATTTVTTDATTTLDTDPGTTSTGDTSTGDTSTGDTDATTGVVEACPCPDLEVPIDDGIFVLSITAQLWKYFPENNMFQQLGALNCDLPPTTFSMAVDRNGYAWVQYQGGQLRKVAVTNVNDCTDPGYVVGQQGITNFGMAFVSNSESDVCDRIYGNQANFIPEGNMVANFFSIDPMNLQLGLLGKSNYGSAEVTGTGDGRAFFFAGQNPAKLIEIDKNTGASLKVTPLPGVELGSAWAFAHFAGDFYFFTNSQGGPGSEVTHIDYDDSDMNGKQDITVVVADAPISIVGAGVSTCAPFAPQ